MKKSILFIIKRFFNGLRNRVSSIWYSQFIGHIGKKSRINYHCELEGNCLDRIYIGEGSVIDSYSIIGCRRVEGLGREEAYPELKIGNKCIIGQYNHITAVNNIAIGDNLLTGRFVLITDNSHGGFDLQELGIHPAKRKIQSKGEVVIGNNVWIGDKVSILPGVHIGDGCIIGANSVVTHDIPPFSLVAGVPARIIKNKTE